MKEVFIPRLELVDNVCDQLLRVVKSELSGNMSMAHVTMNPNAVSRVHRHEKMTEVYVITKGRGQLFVGEKIYNVYPGNVIEIPKGANHALKNMGMTRLEHFVLASPAFDPNDVILEDSRVPLYGPVEAPVSPLQRACDNAYIRAYTFNDVPASIAIGHVVQALTIDHGIKDHRHHHTTEYIYVIEGKGKIRIGGRATSGYTMEISEGMWLEIPPGELHSLENQEQEYMTVMCLCTPPFSEADTEFAQV